MKKDKNFFFGVAMIALMSAVAYLIAMIPAVKALALSPLIIGILVGMLVANTVGARIPGTWMPGIRYCMKQLLRLGIVLYGFRLTLTDVVMVGLPAIVIDLIIIVGTLLIGVGLGRVMRMDRDTALMTSVGSSICGAAAVLGAEPVVKCESYKTAVAVSTVVIFGIISMFLYPIMFRAGWLAALTPQQVAVYTGATLHEVANVAGAGNAMDPTGELGIAGTAIITKMIRVIMLAPVLVVLAFCLKRPSADGKRSKITIPWFAFLFIGVIVVSTLLMLTIPEGFMKEYLYGSTSWMGRADTFLLTMAMTALGCDTTIDKFRQSGAKPFLLALLLFVWLLAGGYLLCRFLMPVLV